MGLQVAYRAAVDGKRPVNKANRLTKTFACSRRLAFAAAAFFAASTASGYAQSGGPFAGMAGVWAGGGTVTLDDGSRERLRCRANYAVAGNSLSMWMPSYLNKVLSVPIAATGLYSGVQVRR